MRCHQPIISLKIIFILLLLVVNLITGEISKESKSKILSANLTKLEEKIENLSDKAKKSTLKRYKFSTAPFPPGNTDSSVINSRKILGAGLSNSKQKRIPERHLQPEVDEHGFTRQRTRAEIIRYRKQLLRSIINDSIGGRARASSQTHRKRKPSDPSLPSDQQTYTTPSPQPWITPIIKISQNFRLGSTINHIFSSPNSDVINYVSYDINNEIFKLVDLKKNHTTERYQVKIKVRRRNRNPIFNVADIDVKGAEYKFTISALSRYASVIDTTEVVIKIKPLTVDELLAKNNKKRKENKKKERSRKRNKNRNKNTKANRNKRKNTTQRQLPATVIEPVIEYRSLPLVLNTTDISVRDSSPNSTVMAEDNTVAIGNKNSTMFSGSGGSLCFCWVLSLIGFFFF